LRCRTRELSEVQYIDGSVLDPGVVDEALIDVEEVYHLAGLPGMWMPDKNDFHEVNCRSTEIMLAAARKRGVSRFLHCSTESILFHPDRSGENAAEDFQPLADTITCDYTLPTSSFEYRVLVETPT